MARATSDPSAQGNLRISVIPADKAKDRKERPVQIVTGNACRRTNVENTRCVVFHVVNRKSAAPDVESRATRQQEVP